jgi:adenosylhomocysteine nucleosidase
VLLIVVGMDREARIVAGRGRVIVGTRGLETALAEGVSGVVSFGLCGGLDPALGVGDLVIDGHGAWVDELAEALPGVVRGAVAGSDEIVGSASAKAALRAKTSAIAVDMESHIVAEAATRAGIPFAVVRAVSDPADRALPRAAQAGFNRDGSVNVLAVLAALLRRPGELPALVQTARDAAKAFASLERSASALTPPPDVS